MKALRLCTGTAVLSVLAAALFAAASPEVARGLSNCTASQLVPALGDVTVNQGLGNYAYRVRGKETLVKFFLTNPTACAVTSTQSINITGATLTVSTAPTGSSPVTAFQSFGLSPAVISAVSTNSPADPVFAVPSNYLTPSGSDLTFTPTFTATVTYSRKSGTSTTSGLTATFSNSSATFDHLTRALRVLVVPMGDATQGVLANTQFTSTDQTSTQNGFSALSRIFPVPGGISALDGTGGIRYTIDLSSLLNLKSVTGAYDGNLKFCGSSGNFDAIKALLAGFMQSWNSNPLNVNKQVDRVLGVVGESISDGADAANVICADGMASVVSPEAWVRAIADKPSSGRIAAVPSRTGSLMAMELTHTWGGETTSTHHSSNVTADSTNPGRAYNVSTRSYLATNRSVMKYSFVTNPPWDDTLTLLEPPDYSYDRCAFGGTIPTDGSCTGLGTTTGTTLGVAAGNSFVVSGTVDLSHTPPTATIVQSGFLSSLQLGEDDNSNYRYVRRDATTHQLLNNIGFHVSFEDTQHNTSAEDDATVQKGLFSFALPDDLPAPGSDPAEVQLWKASSNLASYNPSEPTDVLLYDKTQQPAPPQSLGFATLGSVTPRKYTDTPAIDELHPALSDGGGWIAWEAPLAPSVPGSTVIHVAPSTSSSAVTLPVPTADKHIVFESDRDGNLEIYSMNADGNGQTNLTNNPARDIMPAASPDGSQIAFDSDRSGSEQIWVMSSTGSNPQQLTTQGTNAFPAWSPDGQKIAFMHGAPPTRQIWVMNADGSSQHAVTTGGDDYYPTWSPDGQKIAFASTRGGGNSQIWVTNSDASGSPTQLTTASVGPPIHDQPSWSTDGSKIAFSGGSSSSAYDVWVMKTDGSGQIDLTSGSAADDRVASWSPDGSKIAFTSKRDGSTYDVYVMNADGTGVSRITTNAANDGPASWSPARNTGLSNAFPAWKHSTDAIAYAFAGDLYTQSLSFPGGVPSAAGDPTRIYTAGGGEFGPPAAHHPSWSLDGSSIAFDAGADIYTIPSSGGSAVQITHDTDSHDPSWSHTPGTDLIAYTRGPENCGTSSAKLYAVTPSGTRTSVGNVNCSLFPSFGTNGRIAFTSGDGNIWSIKPDGSDSKQLTIGGQDSFPSAAGNIFVFDRRFAAGQTFEQDIMLTALTTSGNTAFSAESTAPLKAEVDHVVNGTAFPVYLGLDPTDVNGAIQTWYINFDGSNAPSGGVLQTLFTDGVQYTTGTSTVAPTVAPKPPTAAIFTPLDTTYQMGSTFPVSGTGYDAEGQILPASSLHWTLTLPNGTVQDLGSFDSKDIKAPLPAGWPAGTLTFTLTVTDLNGQTATATRNVRVLFDLVGGGFLPPILNPPGVNSAKAGTQYPIKWQLKDASGRYITDLKTVAGVAYQSDGNPPSCDFSTATGPFNPLPTGGTVLRYDSKNNQFVYNWTTPSTAGCYVFQLTLADGSEHQAYFQLS